VVAVIGCNADTNNTQDGSKSLKKNFEKTRCGQKCEWWNTKLIYEEYDEKIYIIYIYVFKRKENIDEKKTILYKFT